MIYFRSISFSSICFSSILDPECESLSEWVFVWACLLLITNGTSRFLDLLQYKVWNLSICTYVFVLFKLDLLRQLPYNNLPRKEIHPWTYVCHRYWNDCHWMLEKRPVKALWYAPFRWRWRFGNELRDSLAILWLYVCAFNSKSYEFRHWPLIGLFIGVTPCRLQNVLLWRT